MKIAIVLKLFCLILSVSKVTCQIERSSTPLNVETQTHRKEVIDTNKDTVRRIQALENCVTSLLEIKIKPLKADDCCLTKICFNNYLLNKIVHSHSQVKGLLLKLCTDKFCLDKENTFGCNLSANILPENYTFSSLLEANRSSSDGSPKIGNKSDNIQSQSEENDDKKIVRSNNGFIASNSPITDGLQFLDVPRGDDMRIPGLRILNEYLLFGPFSTLMGYLQPAGFPLELLKDFLDQKIGFEIFVMQVLKLEMVVVGWILFWAMLSIGLPFAISAQLCCRGNIRRLDEEFSTTGSTTNFYDKWTGNTLVVLLHVLLVLLLCPIILILAGNEQISKSISNAEYSQEIIYEDIHTFIRNTHMQISLVTTSSTDITFEAIRKDFEDLENLLGKPYQQALAAETGIDIALEALQELKISTAQVTNLVSDILNDCTLAGKESVLLQEQLREISRELTTARQQCNLKDRALCYTLQYSGYDVVFSCENITSDKRIQHLHRLGTEDNFNISIDIAGEGFVKIDEHVESDAIPKVSGSY
ncbi:unnamed protein product [Brassicogethes aeneus]|uniref:Uncharacterized protein n=1 Tax=Brassicogethes aeneus TaxID=1431903 RepID=A0A9P0B326_BRAAE|nr:unnamed protein product [Brassicogethes aeneus]